MRQGLIILVILCLCLSVPSRPVSAAGLLSGPDAAFNIQMFILGTIGTSLLAYAIYKNSPAQRTWGYQEELGPGEWYLGGFAGYSYLPPNDWKFTQNDTSNLLGPVAKNITFQPGAVAGIKFGRYFDSIPWFGIEVETNFSRNIIRGNQGSAFPPQPSLPTPVLGGPDYFMIWDIQHTFMFRYGFLKDKEVTFGRLQPYIGIGPGYEIVYGKFDSQKNIAIEAMAGVNYMVNSKIGLFLEYKFSYQFAIEYQDVRISNGTAYTFTQDLPHHRFVVGVAYHFKKLFGN